MKKFILAVLLLPSLAFAGGDVWVTVDDVTVPVTNGCDKYLKAGTDYSRQVVECDVDETFSVIIPGDDGMAAAPSHLTYWTSPSTSGDRACFKLRMAAFRYGVGGNTDTESLGALSAGTIVTLDTTIAYQVNRKTTAKTIWDAGVGIFCVDGACNDTAYNVLEFKRVACVGGDEIPGKLMFLADHLTW